MSRHDMLVMIVVGQGLVILVMVIVLSVLIGATRKLTWIENELYVRGQQLQKGVERATRPLGRIDE